MNTPTSEMRACITMRLHGETYAASAASVIELVMLQPLTRLPTMPVSIRGLMNLRGTVVTVVDLALHLGLGETAITPHTCVAIVETEDEGGRLLTGVIAEEIEDVVMLPGDGIESAPAFGSRINPAFLRGIARVAGRPVLLLDLAIILSADALLAGAGKV